MEKTAPPDALVVSGDPLRQAREARGLSVPEMAAVVTLSREQVRALEDGGNAPFYSAAHKRLALKKYAAALGIPWPELVAGSAADPVPGPAPAAAAPEAVVRAVPATPTDIRMAAAERNARLRRQLLMAAVASAVVLAFYAKQRGSTDVTPAPAAIETGGAEGEADVPAIATLPYAAAAATEPTAGLPAPAAADPAPVATSPAEAVPGAAGCTLPPAADLPALSPPYQRKPDARLFLVSGTPIELCIADASGQPSLITLKPGAGQVFAGKPPYLVQSDRLGAVEIYLQGMRVRAPAGATAVRLVPTQLARPPEVAASPSPE